MPVKVITDYKSLEYFITTKKLTRRQVHQVEFLLGFNFVIFYPPSRKNQKADSLIRRPNKFLSDDHDNCKQYLLQTIFPTKKPKIISIEGDNNNTIVDQVV